MKPNTKPRVIVLLTGGVSGGHAVPTLSTYFFLRGDYELSRNFSDIRFIYFGRKKGLERSVFEKLVDKYFVVPTIKWRGGFSIVNFLGLFQFPSCLVTVFQYFFSLRKEYFLGNKVVLFSSGSYISLPVVLVGYLFRIPIFIHEQTSRAGLANRIGGKFAKKVLITFQSSSHFFPKKKVLFTGYPFSKKIRFQLRKDDSLEKCTAAEAIAKTFSIEVPSDKKILLVMGGSMGSVFLNKFICDALPLLTKEFFVFHQVGRDNIENYHQMKTDCYFPVGFVGGEIWIDLLHKADVVVARSGAGSVNECIYLKKKVIFVPYKLARADEQYYNALEAKKYINCVILREEEINKNSDQQNFLMDVIHRLLQEPPINRRKEKSLELFIERTSRASENICKAIKSFVLERKVDGRGGHGRRQFSEKFSSSNKKRAQGNYKPYRGKSGKKNWSNKSGRPNKFNEPD